MESQEQPRDPLRTFLADRDVPCPGCEYNLRGLAESVCPECGIELDLEVIPKGQKKPPPLWTAGRVPLVIIMLFAILAIPLGGLFGVMAIVGGDVQPGLASLGMAAAYLWGFTLEGRWRKQLPYFVAKPPGQQRLLVAGCWLIAVVLGYFFLAVMGSFSSSMD